MGEITWRMMGNKLIIEVEITALDVANAQLSKTRKSRVVVSSGAPTIVAVIDRKPVSFMLNVLTSR